MRTPGQDEFSNATRESASVYSEPGEQLTDVERCAVDGLKNDYIFFSQK